MLEQRRESPEATTSGQGQGLRLLFLKIVLYPIRAAQAFARILIGGLKRGAKRGIVFFGRPVLRRYRHWQSMMAEIIESQQAILACLKVLESNQRAYRETEHGAQPLATTSVESAHKWPELSAQQETENMVLTCLKLLESEREAQRVAGEQILSCLRSLTAHGTRDEAEERIEFEPVPMEKYKKAA